MVALLVILGSLAAALADPQVIAAHPQAVGVVGTAVGVLIAVLRTITTTPPGQSGDGNG